MSYIDAWLNKITMYRLVLYCLGAEALSAFIVGFSGLIAYPGFTLVFSLAWILAVCLGGNWIFAKLFRAPSNLESTLITAGILFFIMSPSLGGAETVYLTLAGLLAITSKYLLAIRHKHIFNPAALAAALLGFTSAGGAIWWVGTPYLLPFTLVGGLLIVRKIRREALFLACVGTSIVVVAILGLMNHTSLTDILIQHFFSWPIIFFASVMVTEPLTTPPTKKLQMLYGALVGALSSWPLHWGTIFSTPELSLLIGNLFSYSCSLRQRLTLTLQGKKLIAADTYEFIFNSKWPLSFKPGQYLEWTIPHTNPDNRGIRRYFTIASAPSEKTINLGVKCAANMSSFKQKLVSLVPGDIISAGQLAGDFTLPTDTSKKLVFIAGGIGITPFRSMLKQLSDTKENRDIVLFYSNRRSSDIAYQNLLIEAQKNLSLKIVLLLSEDKQLPPLWTCETGPLTPELLKKHVADYNERLFYLSGPNAMVDCYRELLKTMGVHGRSVHTDYFPGFA